MGFVTLISHGLYWKCFLYANICSKAFYFIAREISNFCRSAQIKQAQCTAVLRILGSVGGKSIHLHVINAFSPNTVFLVGRKTDLCVGVDVAVLGLDAGGEGG